LLPRETLIVPKKQNFFLKLRNPNLQRSVLSKTTAFDSLSVVEDRIVGL
jgi:hypothetical protein